MKEPEFKTRWTTSGVHTPIHSPPTSPCRIDTGWPPSVRPLSRLGFRENLCRAHFFWTRTLYQKLHFQRELEKMRWLQARNFVLGVGFPVVKCCVSLLSHHPMDCQCSFCHWKRSDCYCCCWVVKLCLTLCDPMDCSTPDSSVLHYPPRVCSNSCPLSWWC